LITLYGALGAIVAKFAAKAIYQTFGFKPVALAMTFASAALMAVVGLFDAATPVWMMAAVLIAAGLVRSTFFTGINAMSFADVSNEESGQATAMFTVFTQLSLAVGVALAGATLEFLSSGHGGAPTQGDFRMGFFVVAAVALFAFLPFLGLSRDAGSDVSGHFTEKDIEEAPVAAGK
jgi:MFS family permease